MNKPMNRILTAILSIILCTNLTLSYLVILDYKKEPELIVIEIKSELVTLKETNVEADKVIIENIEDIEIVEENIYEGVNITNRWNITLTDEEKQLLAYITMRESGNQSDEGQQAVVEVILNRIYSVEFPNTLEEVVSQKTNGTYQFSSYPTRTKFEPTEQVYANIEKVLNGETSILPFQTLYFSKGGQANMEIETKIGDHVFNNQKDYIEVETENVDNTNQDNENEEEQYD